MSDQAYLGWRVDPEAREALLERFPPRFADAVAHHVTLRHPAPEGAGPPAPASARIVGRACDERGVEALVVEVDGSSERPDGGVFHVTWSLDRRAGRRAHESNAVIAEHGWTPVEPVDLPLIPERFEPD